MMYYVGSQSAEELYQEYPDYTNFDLLDALAKGVTYKFTPPLKPSGNFYDVKLFFR